MNPFKMIHFLGQINPNDLKRDLLTKIPPEGTN